jgi:hypothetical protein
MATSPLRLTTSNFIFQLNTCGHSPYVTFSLTRGRVCWSSPAQSVSGPSPVELMTIFYCLRFKTPSTWRTRSPYLYPPETEWPGYTPRHWVHFSTRRATVDVFDSASTWMWIVSSKSKSKSHCDWRSVSQSWCRAPSEAHYQIFTTVWQ